MLTTATLFALVTLATQSSVDARAKDWRNGAVIYQVFVDRFAKPTDLAAKKALFKAPRRLMDWSDLPKGGTRLADLGLWTHELEFWGGDLAGVDDKLDYIRQIGADVLYLTPIFKAYTNHKYDTQDYNEISPDVGTQADFVTLTKDVHKRNMKLILDGVFNHMGKTSSAFQDAFKDSRSRYRSWFDFGPEYSLGYRGFAGVGNLPALKLENPEVRRFLWNDDDSIVQKYLREGIDGWRLDVAFEIGHNYLSELTKAAHAVKPGSEVVGEISGYPSDWFPAVDGVFNFHALYLAGSMVKGEISGGRVGQMLAHEVSDAGLDNLLKSWLLTDNHDTPRLASVIPEASQRRLIQALQFTLPGSPVIYYGSELGMIGSGDPENRAPMRWDLVNDQNQDLAMVRKLVKIRKDHPALRYGDFTALDTDKLLAFTRTTGKLRESVIVIINPTDQVVKETFSTRIGRLMSWGELQDLLTVERIRTPVGTITAEMKPRSAMILVPFIDRSRGYSPYDRIESN